MAEKKDTRYIETVGRRKTAIARVRITPASKMSFSVNGKPLEEYFPTDTLRALVADPFKKASEADESTGHFSVSAKMTGGGISSQAGALRHGIARALVKNEEALRSPLKQEGFLTRDPRMKERRKFGLKKARRAPQWSKR